MSTIVPRSHLQSMILQLASHEHDCSAFVTPLLLLSDRIGSSSDAWAIIAAANRLIEALFSYGRFISIGDEYFRPCLDSFTPYFSLNWTKQGYNTFCAGCSNREWHCTASAFSSKCCRFHLAHAAEHIAVHSNRLIHQLVNL